MHGEGVKGLMKRALKLSWNRCYAFTLFTLQQLSFVSTRSMRNEIVPFIKPLLYLVAFCQVHGHVKGRFRNFCCIKYTWQGIFNALFSTERSCKRHNTSFTRAPIPSYPNGPSADYSPRPLESPNDQDVSCEPTG
jgi:hypothetical protein